MPTVAAPRGKTLDYLIKDETSFGVSPTGNWLKTFLYEYNLDFKKPLEPDPLLGIDRNNNRDTTQPGPGLPALTGNVIAPLDFNHIGYWLRRTFGAPADSGSTDYIHVFTSGGEALPYFSDEAKLASNVFLVDNGLIVSKLSFDLSRKAGFDRFTAELMGQKQVKNAATGGGTPVAAIARSAVAAALPVAKIDTVQVADVMSLQAAYDNKIKPQEYVGSQYITGHDLDNEATFEFTLRMRFRNATLYDQAAAGTPLALELLWFSSSTLSLSILAPKCRLDPTGIPVTGPAGIEASFTGKAEQDSSNPMLTVTLKNQIASYS